MREILGNDYIKVLLGLVVGLGVIIYFNPPHTPCTSQMGVYSEGIKPLIKPFNKNLNLCKQFSDAGGCLPFFETVGKMSTKLKELGNQCQAELSRDERTRVWLTTAMEIFVRVAWGTKPPESYIKRNNWLEMSHLAQFCQLRKFQTTIYGESAWLEFVNYMLSDLPGAAALGREGAWQRSILSDGCKYAL
jgi:hypothetical protein